MTAGMSASIPQNAQNTNGDYQPGQSALSTAALVAAATATATATASVVAMQERQEVMCNSQYGQVWHRLQIRFLSSTHQLFHFITDAGNARPELSVGRICTAKQSKDEFMSTQCNERPDDWSDDESHELDVQPNA